MAFLYRLIFFHQASEGQMYVLLLMLTHLARADGASVIFQNPDLPVVFHLAVMDAVPSTVVPMRTSAVISTIQIKTDGVIGTGTST